MIAVWRLDRLGRSLADLLEIVGQLEKRGIGFMSVTEAIDTTTSGGRLVFQVFGAMAELAALRICTLYIQTVALPCTHPSLSIRAKRLRKACCNAELCAMRNGHKELFRALQCRVQSRS